MKYPFLLPVALVAIPAVAAAVKPTPAKRPNLLFVIADQWRGNALGFMGVEPVLTPNLDRFAGQGVALTNAVSGYPVSSPARAMIMTGAYPHNTGVPANCNSKTAPQNVELKADMMCFSDVLKAEGYSTGYIGKWHLDKPVEPFVDTYNNRGETAWNEWCEPSRRHGFDYWHAYGTYDYHTKPMYWDTDAVRDEFQYFNQWGPEHEADMAIEFLGLNSAGEAPFALVVSMNPPHTGYELVPDKYKALYKDLNVDSIAAAWPEMKGVSEKNLKFFCKSLPDYYACMSGVDEQFGRIMAELDRLGMADNTVVVFSSDHGDMMGMHDMIGKNIFYEGSMHVPMLIRHSSVKSRVDDKLLISFEDLNPTMMSLLGLGDRIPSSVQSRDLSAQVKGSRRAMPTDQLYFYYSEGEGELILPTNGRRGIRTDRYTMAMEWRDGKVVSRTLFDRKADPFELTNIATTNADQCAKLEGRLLARLRSIGDPIMTN